MTQKLGANREAMPHFWSGERLKKGRKFNVIIERSSEGYLVVSVPSPLSCHIQAKSLGELMERIREAIEFCLEVEEETAESLEFVGIQRVLI